jgi:protein-disulfide isomerase
MVTNTKKGNSSAQTSSTKNPNAAKVPVNSVAKKPAATHQPVNNSNIGLWLITVSVAIVAAVVGLIVFNENRARSAPVAQPNVPSEWIDRNVAGSSDAPVVITMWEDFLCPSCQSFNATVKPQLFEMYVETGKVRVVYRYFPLSGHEPGATMAALAAECAADQGMFWPYHDRVYQMTRVDQQGAVQFDDLVDYASTMGMNESIFRTCLSTQQHGDTVSSSLAEAQQLQLQGTPSIFVGDTLLPDYSFPTLQAEIERQLTQAS